MFCRCLDRPISRAAATFWSLMLEKKSETGTGTPGISLFLFLFSWRFSISWRFRLATHPSPRAATRAIFSKDSRLLCLDHWPVSLAPWSLGFIGLLLLTLLKQARDLAYAPHIAPHNLSDIRLRNTLLCKFNDEEAFQNLCRFVCLFWLFVLRHNFFANA